MFDAGVDLLHLIIDGRPLRKTAQIATDSTHNAHLAIIAIAALRALVFALCLVQRLHLADVAAFEAELTLTPK